jgi:hypothetical protein
MSIPFTNNNPRRNSIVPQEEQGPVAPNVQRGSESRGEGYRRNTGSTFHDVLASIPSPEEDRPPQEILQSARRHSSRAENSLFNPFTNESEGSRSVAPHRQHDDEGPMPVERVGDLEVVSPRETILSQHTTQSDRNQARHQELRTTAIPEDSSSMEEAQRTAPSSSLLTVLYSRKARPWLLGAALTAIIILVIIIALGVSLSKLRQAKISNGASTDNNSTSLMNVTIDQPSDVPPKPDTLLGAADIIKGTYFGKTADKPQTKYVYDTEDGKICVRTELDETWLPTLVCIENANAKPGTPLTILDWVGGPSIYFFTNDNIISGIDHVPSNDSWVISSISTRNVSVNPVSQISSTTWLNGSSAWVYYQDENNQLREFGLDDYRNQPSSWRDGSSGPLGLAAAGSWFAALQYSNGTDEFEEAWFQANSGSIHGKRYASNVWEDSDYAISSTASGVALGAPFDVTNVVGPDNTNTLLVAYVTTDGFINVAHRGTVNITDFGAFSKPVQVVQTDGANGGLVVDGGSGTPKMYNVHGQKILQFTSDTMMTVWTNGTDITA